MLQIALFLVLFLIIVIPTGHYLYKVADKQKTVADPIFDKIDGVLYKVCKINRKEMSWRQYLVAILVTNAAMVLVGYVFLRLQEVLFLNPNGAEGLEASLAFNTIISFMTNTNLQHYAGETGLSYLSQMAVITMLMFTSAATGYSACMAFLRGITGYKNMGNFYEDFIRVITRVLLPFASIVSVLLIAAGVPQNLSANQTVRTIEGAFQDIAMGPVASLESIKHLGTNGGGFFGANSSTPFENPSVLSNMVEMLSMMLLPAACVVVLGLFYYYRPKAESEKLKKHSETVVVMGGDGLSIFVAMSLLFLLGLGICLYAESAGNPLLAQAGLSQSAGSMEGKETRFGVQQSALFTAVTTSFTTGSVNNMHDTLTPLGGLVALTNMMLNVVFGGIGVGLMNMITYAILAVFLCGLMIGRTPEYLGKKIESKEMKLVVIGIIIHPLLILGFSALAVSTKAGLAGVTNPGFHGLSQVLYEYASSAANNGSGFEGLADNTVFWNITTGFAMFFGRYIAIVLQLAIAGSLLVKKPVNESAGSLQTSSTTFSIVLVVVVLIFAALTFFPFLALGPVAEQLVLWA